MIVYDRLDVLHAAVTNFNLISAEFLFLKFLSHFCNFVYKKMKLILRQIIQRERISFK